MSRIHSEMRPGHEMVLARRELSRWAKRTEAEASGELEPKHAPRAI